MFSGELIQELQKVLAEDYKVKVSQTEAIEIAYKLIETFELLAKINYRNNQSHV